MGRGRPHCVFNLLSNVEASYIAATWGTRQISWDSRVRGRILGRKAPMRLDKAQLLLWCIPDFSALLEEWTNWRASYRNPHEPRMLLLRRTFTKEWQLSDWYRRIRPSALMRTANTRFVLPTFVTCFFFCSMRKNLKVLNAMVVVGAFL